MTLDERKFRILQAIIDDYILTAVPVGSRTLSRKQGMGLSSATIRNEMSDLEELGYLDQPHTSSGRIPSWRAYRLYVDQLMRFVNIPPQEDEKIRSIFSQRMHQMEEVVASTARILSDMTDYTAVVLAPQVSSQKLKRLQFVRVNDERALMVVVFDSGQTQEALVRIPRDWPDDHLHMLSVLISQHIDGKASSDLQGAIRSITGEIEDHSTIFKDLIEAVRQGVVSSKPEVVLGGRSKLLNHPEYADIEKARNMLTAFEASDHLANLLSSKSSLEFSVSIGPEMELVGMEDCSLVTVSYRLGGERTGTMGVIGPTRMNYARVLSVLESMRITLQQVFDAEG